MGNGKFKHHALACGWIAAAGSLDAATGVELSLQLLYLAPCSWLAWKVGRSAALTMSVIGAGVWLAADAFDGHTYSHPVFAASNALTLLAFLCGSSVMLSHLAAALKRETHNARVDHLTGLWNARAFYELGERELATATRQGGDFAVAYLDLDDFKQVNETLGHLHADVLLRLVGRTLRNAVRKSDIVGRLGGDEFAIVLPLTPIPDAEMILRRALEAVVVATRAEGFRVSFSVGCVSAPAAELDGLEALLKSADRRMYDAKYAGKASIVLTDLTPSRST